MQCVNCQFENMPGLEQCCRCGASLRIATAVIDVHPPRAAKRTFSQRVRYRRRSRWFVALVGFVMSAARWFAGGASEIRGWRPFHLPMLFVPGWPQRVLGRPRWRLFLFGWLAMIAASALTWGTLLGIQFVGLVFAIHLMSVIDVVWLGCSDPKSRRRYAALYAVMVAVVLYIPTGMLLARVAVPLRMVQDAEPLLAGDVLIYSTWSTPQPGDLVVFDMARVTIPRVEGHNNNLMAFQGRQIDRILAGPGQTFRVEKGQLLVDGQPSSWRPLNEEFVFSEGELTVPAGCYLVLPTLNPLLPDALTSGLWQRRDFLLTTRERIVGTVYFRTSPLSRMGSVD